MLPGTTRINNFVGVTTSGRREKTDQELTPVNTEHGITDTTLSGGLVIRSEGKEGESTATPGRCLKLDFANS